MTGRSRHLIRTRFWVEQDTLVVDLGTRRPVLSSAPRGGGLVRVRYILNHQVPANPVSAPVRRKPRAWGDPARDLGKVARRLGIDRRCVALMTAVPLKQLVVLREESDGFWVEGFFTVGVTNAVRAGDPLPRTGAGLETKAAGTINVILVTNASLASSAMVGAIQVATEAKTSVLLERRVPGSTGRPGATGTGTDAVVVASGEGPVLRYSGTHTKAGAMIGRLVTRGVAEGLQRSHRRQAKIAAQPGSTKCCGGGNVEHKRS